MKKIKLITSLSALATTATVLSTGFALTAAVDITTLNWVTRSVLSSNHITKIQSEILSDNNILFSRYRDLRANITVTVTPTSNINEFTIRIDGDGTKYTGYIEWTGWYSNPLPPVQESYTYDELSSLVAADGIVVGQQYVLSNYKATVDSTITTARATSNQIEFYLILTGTSENTFSDTAIAAKKKDSTSSTNFDGWKVSYSFENNTSKYAWADTVNGRGVIYYMQDEFGNSCPYDFKNIQFNISDTETVEWRYTFSTGTATEVDASIEGDTNNVYGNEIKTAKINGGVQILNQIVFKGKNCFNNTFGNDCTKNVFGSDCNNNSFGTTFTSNKIGSYFSSNTFGNSCSNNDFHFGSVSYQYTSNTFGSGIHFVNIGGNVLFMYNMVVNTAGTKLDPVNLNDPAGYSGQVIVNGNPL